MVLPPLKLHAIGNKINCVATAGPLLHRSTQEHAAGHDKQQQTKARHHDRHANPQPSREIPTWPISIAAYTSAMRASSVSKVAATISVTGRPLEVVD